MAKNKMTGLNYEKLEKDLNKVKETLKNRSPVKSVDSDQDEGCCELIEQAHTALDISVEQLLTNMELCRDLCEHFGHPH